MVNKIALPVAIAAIGLAAAACGGSTGGSSSKASSSSGTTDEAKLEKYSQCMRSHGVPSFPDPVDGRLSPTVRKGGPLDPSNPQFQSAQKACRSLAPAGALGGSAPSHSQQSGQLKFAACMRKNGVPDFPDPQGGHIVAGGNLNPSSPQFQSAVQACQKLIPGGIGGGGQ
jgi:hypothetical protein